MNKNEIKIFNMLEKQRKSLYKRIDKIEDDKKRISLKKNYMKLKDIFKTYKTDKNKIDKIAVEKLKTYLDNFIKFLDKNNV